ncbi:MAG: histidine kinase dimerization/phospho-acceptor domain-containing protein, partial [Rhodococcus sp. (in: high G+C Gram-positive bacteria)]
MRTALLSAVGHDLRTPLASMKASVSTLLSPDVALAETDARELLEGLDDALNRLTKLVTNLLDASRLSTGAINPRLEPVTYDELVASNITYLDKSRIVTAHTDDGVSPVLA